MSEPFTRIREKNTALLTQRMQEVRKTYPEVEALLNQKAELIAKGHRAFVSPQRFAQHQSDLKTIDERIKAELEKNGRDPEYLQPIFECKQCQDTGYVQEKEKRKRCTCHPAAQMDAPKIQELTLEMFGAQPDGEFGKSQRENMQAVYEHCRDYCRRFPHNEKRNLLFYGGAGLGKSHLAQAMAREICEGKHSTCVINSYKLMDAFKQKHIGGEDYAYPLYSCDFLVIDDLGTEPLYNNITVEYLFALLNERMEHHKATMVITNLDFEHCQQRYGERIASRIYDKHNNMSFAFFGNDLRMSKQK